MSLRAYCEINLHMTWHVNDNLPVLTNAIEARTHEFLRGEAIKAPGVFFHEIGGTDDHVHLVVSIPPTLTISKWIGILKGASTHFINHEIVNRKLLDWQAGYGVVTFGTKDLPWVVAYVRNQRAHHAQGTAIERLERTECVEEQTGQGPDTGEAR